MLQRREEYNGDVMKKVSVLILSILVVSWLIPTYSAKANDSIELDDPLRLEHVVITLLMPEIEKSVNAFYSPYLTDIPIVASYIGTHIINIKGGEDIHTNGPNATHYTITVEVFPFVGPHVSVGKDHVTLDIAPDEIVTLNNFQHIESYELPWNLKPLIKKALP